MKNEITMVDRTNTAKVGDLQYGTFLTMAPNNPESFYIKVNKLKLGAGLSLDFPRQHSVLCNIKTGTLRTIPGDSRVVVLCAAVELSVVGADDIKDFRKF